MRAFWRLRLYAIASDLWAAYKQVESIYKAAGAADNLDLDLHPGDYGWDGNKPVVFFERHLS